MPLGDVERAQRGFVATGHEPWLRLDDPRSADFAGAMVSITYRASAWDVPARPLFRFLSENERLAEMAGPAPFEAAAVWTGRVPRGTTRIHVSPTNALGPFAFRIESVRKRAWPALLAAGVRRARGPARSAVLTRLIGWEPESDSNLAWAIGAYPLHAYDDWAKARRRELDLAGVDRLDPAAVAMTPIHVVLPPQPAGSLERTLASLRAQVLDRWRALVVGPLPDTCAADPRITRVDTVTEAAALLGPDDAWFTVPPAGAALLPTALALVAARRAREPHVRVFYGDEFGADGPSLKPGWCPRLARALPYLGRGIFAAAAIFTPAELVDLIAGGDWTVPATVAPVPLRRPVLARREPIGVPRPASRPPSLRGVARATIVVPTRDQPVMLQRLVASIRARSAPASFRLVVVDNGDAGGPAAAFLAELGAAPDATVLSRPGPFNFSALCNEASRADDGAILLFLNDDMEVVSDHWLERLAGHAATSDIGAVGARLSYPDGRLQHVGVLAGMGGSAGHFGAPAPADDPGWAGRNLVPHEVSAVTGACLAVAREKFEAVGGFDAIHLPVELSDIDLCLKLNARGWQTLVDPAVHLLHEESFSRGGATFRRLSKYGDQRAIFQERWRAVLRDDPVFHPALSLYSWRAALG